MDVSNVDNGCQFYTIASVSEYEESKKDFDLVDVLFVTRIPVASYTFNWIVNQPCSLSINNELYSPYVCQLRLFSCRLKLIKYENGFGLFHVYETRHDDETVNNTMTVASGSTSVDNLENTLPCSEKDDSDKYPCPRVIEYQVSVVDKEGKERVKWTTSFCNKNDNECFSIGEYRSKTWKKCFSDALLLRCCIKVTKIPETEKMCLDTECNEKHSLKKLSEDLKSLYENVTDADIILEVGTENIPVNSCILCARSSVLKNMINNINPKPNSVEITDAPLSTVKKFVEFLYTGNIDEVTKGILFGELCDLYSLADKYRVQDLRLQCGCKLMSIASADNACQIALLANRHDDVLLKSHIFNFIRLGFETIVDSNAWRNLMQGEAKLASEIQNLCFQKFNAGADK